MLDVIVFGTGNYLQKYKKYLENKEINIVAYLDNNINDWLEDIIRERYSDFYLPIEEFVRKYDLK